MAEQNGASEQPSGGGWPDGMTIKWKACPGCGHTGAFFEAVTEGERVVKPAGTTKLFLWQLPYETLLGPKMITAMMDICPGCGLTFCRGIMKAPVQQQQASVPFKGEYGGRN